MPSSERETRAAIDDTQALDELLASVMRSRDQAVRLNLQFAGYLLDVVCLDLSQASAGPATAMVDA